MMRLRRASVIALLLLAGCTSGSLIGALGIAAIVVIASRAAIDRTTASYYGGPNPDAQADRRRQSNLAITGLGTLCIGFALQIVANWPR